MVIGGSERQGMHEARIMLDLLQSVERDGGQTQRHLASELGVALGLVNAYLKRCVKKGLLKVGDAPARRYAYYLTPQGFAEKARLTVEYFSYSFSIFRRARSEYGDVLRTASSRGFSKIVIAGVSDLAEIATICALECGAEVVGVVDELSSQSKFVGVPVFASFDEVAASFDAVVIAALHNGDDVLRNAIERYGADRVYAPPLLGLSEHAAISEVS
jgi:DNA-binding MarR family transcriptional regulator